MKNANKYSSLYFIKLNESGAYFTPHFIDSLVNMMNALRQLVRDYYERQGCPEADIQEKIQQVYIH